MRIQRGVRGIYREQVAGRVDLQIEKAIRRTAERFQCSRSFVIAVACADFFGIETDRFNKPRREQVDVRDKRDTVVKFPRSKYTLRPRKRA